MAKEKIISVIITTYNSEKTIERTLNSIFNQVGLGKLFLLDVIVVDDCSTDQTMQLVQQYDVRLFSTNKNSGGPNKGRNIGLQESIGHYICIADHDDEWKPHKLKTQLPHLEKVPIVTSGYSVISQSRDKVIDNVKPNGNEFIYYGSNKTFLDKLQKSLYGQNVYLGSIIYSSDLKHILFEENFGMIDFDWILRLFMNRDSIEVNQSLYLRHIDGQNLSLNEEYRKRDFYFSLMHLEEYVHEWPKEVRVAQKKIYGSRARYYYLMGNMNKARYYFRRSHFSLKTIGYYVTTYWGSEFIKRRFNIFG